MTSPTASNVPAPAEGLPPCIKGLATSDARVAVWTVPCWHAEFWAEMVQSFGSSAKAMAGIPQAEHLVRQGQRRGKKLWHGLPIGLRQSDAQTAYAGDDPDEAQAAFERGAEYVRTGEMP